MALSERVLPVIAEVTPEELAETRRWCELGDRVHLLSDLTEGRVSVTPLKRKRTDYMREYARRRCREDPGFRRKRLARQSEWRKKNPEKIREYNQGYHARRYRQDPEFRERRLNYLREYRGALKLKGAAKLKEKRTIPEIPLVVRSTLSEAWSEGSSSESTRSEANMEAVVSATVTPRSTA